MPIFPNEADSPFSIHLSAAGGSRNKIHLYPAYRIGLEYFELGSFCAIDLTLALLLNRCEV